MSYVITTAQRLGHDLKKPGLRVLDFGCGDGHIVKELADLGVDAYGVDIDRVALAKGGERCLYANGRLPFPDNHFDFIYANQVLEHVTSLPITSPEVYRVLKPGGAWYTASPAKYGLCEPHIDVPFVHWLPKSGGWRLAWLRICHRLGIGDFHGASPEDQEAYLREHTFYRSRAEMRAILGRCFRVRFVAAKQLDAALKERGKALPSILAPLAEWAVGTFHEHRMLLQKR